MNQQAMRVAIYARVSSEQQAQAQTIASQVSALDERVAADGLSLEDELRFLDEGFSGSTLMRPALERLRDQAYAGSFQRLYVHSPDRLARKYAYQVLLVEELKHAGVELVFLNHTLGTTPEEDLFLQMQGMIAEYERAKILERSRRGKRHGARRGSVNVLSGAPYGYRYRSGRAAGGDACYEVVPDEARIVQRIFAWIGQDRLSIGEVCRRLKAEAVLSPKGKSWWDRSTVWGILKTPAFQGSAAFGKTRIGEPRRQLRPQRNRTAKSRRTYSVYDMPVEEQVSIPVPPLVSPELFAAVQQQLSENRHRSRQRRRGARYLLQGLLECSCCGYAYYGKLVSKAAAKGKTPYAYYRCVGTDAYRFGGQRICQNKQLRTDLVDAAVWEDVRTLLRDPASLRQEFERRLQLAEQPSVDKQRLEHQIQNAQRSISRLIDAYAEGLLEKSDFEPRIRPAKQRLEHLQATATQAAQDHVQRQELQQAVRQLEQFAQHVQQGLDEADWATRREIIRALVKSVKVETDQVRITYRISYRPFDSGPLGGQSLQYRWRSDRSALRRSASHVFVPGRSTRASPLVGFFHRCLKPHLDQP